jgi:hypothetical protein
VVFALYALYRGVSEYFAEKSQSKPNLLHSGAQLLIGMIWVLMKFTKKNDYASVVVLSALNIEMCLYVNLALRNAFGTELPIDMLNLQFYRNMSLALFSYTNCLLLHSMKWTLFLNGPVWMISFYLETWADLQAQNNVDPLVVVDQTVIFQKVGQAFGVFSGLVLVQYLQ